MRVNPESFERVHEFVNALNPSSLFDAGFGNARWLEWCVKNNVKWAGVEVDEEQVLACDHPQACKASVTEIPFNSNDWDVVLLVEVIEHLPDEKSVVMALKEAYRLCRPGGCVVITTPNCEDERFLRENRLTYFHYDARYWSGKKYSEECSHQHFLTFTPDRLSEVMKLAVPEAERKVLRKMKIGVLKKDVFYKLWGVIEKRGN